MPRLNLSSDYHRALRETLSQLAIVFEAEDFPDGFDDDARPHVTIGNTRWAAAAMMKLADMAEAQRATDART